MKKTTLFNIIADNWTNGTYCLGQHVDNREEAEKAAKIYRDRYEGKPFPNGKGWYPYKNFRVVTIPRRRS